MAIELTDEIRQAVHDEECAKLGHAFDTSTVLTMDLSGGGTKVVLSDRDKAPHLSCPRCGRVWLLVEQNIIGYDAAENDLLGRLPADDALAAKLKARRERRAAGPAPARRPGGVRPR